MVESLTINTQNFFEGKFLEKRYEKNWNQLSIKEPDTNTMEDEEEEKEENKPLTLNGIHVLVDEHTVNSVDMTCSCCKPDCDHITQLIERY